MSLPARGDFELSPEEAETLGAVISGKAERLRTRDLVRLNLLRLIMTRGTQIFEPTALGYDWYRRHREEITMVAKKKSAAKKSPKKPVKRELIDTGTNKLYVRRNARGTSFKEVEDVGSLVADRRRKAKTVAKPGQGDRGDRH